MVRIISEQNLDFLERHHRDVGLDLSKVASSSSQLKVGDVILFNYHGEGYFGESRLALVVRPVTKPGKGGNRLLSLKNISSKMTLTPEVVNNLYNNSLSLVPNADGSHGGYRTFILSEGTIKNIFRIEPLSNYLMESLESMQETE